MRQLAESEFPGYDPDEMLKLPPTTRRKFMQIMGASMALAGLTLSGCRRWPEEKLAPYTVNPRGRLPGVPEQYATVMELGGVAMPLLVTSFDGRPIKIEGNPTHPFSQTIPGKQGAATALAQASVLELYDPYRSRHFATVDPSTKNWVASDLTSFQSAFASILGSAGAGDKFAVLIESTSSPSTARMKELCLQKFPKMGWFEYEPLSRDNETAGIKASIGRAARPMLRLDKATIIVSFDADILGAHPAQIRYASDWAAKRRSADEADGVMNRMYVFESAFTLTGTVADARVPIVPSRIPLVLSALASQLGVAVAPVTGITPEESKVIAQIVVDLKANPGKSVVTAGAHLPPVAHQLALSINNAIGAIDSTLELYAEPNGDRPSHLDAIADLTSKLKSKQFDTLLVLGGNPAYDAPADLDFANVLKSVPNTVRLGLHFDETSDACKWHVPRAHYLEAWGDALAWDGSVSIVQPLIEPIFGGKTIDEVLAMVGGSPETTSDAIVRKTFNTLPGAGSDLVYRTALNDGIYANKDGTPAAMFSRLSMPLTFAPIGPMPAAPAASGFEVRFQQSSAVYDGRFASNGWLQELPDTMTKIVWDNAALISKADADKNSVTTGDVISVSVNGKSLSIAAYVLPGQPIGVIGLPLGYGRTGAGPVGSGLGFNTYQLRTTTGAFTATGATISKTGDTYALALTQNHQLIDKIGMEGREERVGAKYQNSELIREASITELKANPSLFKRKADGTISLQLYDPPAALNPHSDPNVQPDPDAHAWGMAIDMSSCIGCSACVIACQAENNIPLVGKDNVEMNRQMHWIRIDRYFKGDPNNATNDAADDPNPEVSYQPLMCQHCENAPCEQVCPVGATMHDTEGLNVMVYNRCIGTRYCSNNCPYKVRRFNYLDWQSQDPRHDKYPVPYLNIPDLQQREQVDEIKRMVFNPEVTIRMRGVMEKCTYCVQRIHNTKTAKRAAGVELVDGDIISACQQTCPTQAIVFGDLNDKNSRVSKLHQNKRSYALLNDLDTRPRTLYLGKVRNPQGSA